MIWMLMMLFIFFTCPIHLHQSFSEIFPYSVTPGYITDDGDGVGSPGSNTSGFFLLILVIMSALRMMMMMSAMMMALEICRKQRHRPHAECLLVCNCVEIVKLSSLQLFKCSVSEYQMVSALCRLHTLLSLWSWLRCPEWRQIESLTTDGPGLEYNTRDSCNGCSGQKLQLHVFSSERFFHAT